MRLNELHFKLTESWKKWRNAPKKLARYALLLSIQLTNHFHKFSTHRMTSVFNWLNHPYKLPTKIRFLVWWVANKCMYLLAFLTIRNLFRSEWIIVEYNTKNIQPLAYILSAEFPSSQILAWIILACQIETNKPLIKNVGIILLL